MNQRRTFLKVLGAGAFVSACGGSDTDTSSATAGGGDGSGGAGGGGGTGGGGNPTTSSTTGSGSSTSTASASGAGGAGGAGGGSSSGLPDNYTVIANVADVMQDTLTPVGKESVLIGRDAMGIYVMSALCTHQQCNMCFKGQISPIGIRCTCHSSKFDMNGAVTQGPAQKPLPHYDCAVGSMGEIGVDKKTVVDAGFRAAIP